MLTSDQNKGYITYHRAYPGIMYMVHQFSDDGKAQR